MIGYGHPLSVMNQLKMIIENGKLPTHWIITSNEDKSDAKVPYLEAYQSLTKGKTRFFRFDWLLFRMLFKIILTLLLLKCYAKPISQKCSKIVTIGMKPWFFDMVLSTFWNSIQAFIEWENGLIYKVSICSHLV